METKVDLSKYIVNVQGKDFITFPGLLAEAHAQGLVGVETTLINEDMSNPVVKAVVTIKIDPDDPKAFKVFTGYGDANKDNVAPKVVKALLRMAETRAIARALRFACNIDMTAIEELDSEENSINTKSNKKTNTTPLKMFSAPKTEKKSEQKEEIKLTPEKGIAFNRRPKLEPNFP